MTQTVSVRKAWEPHPFAFLALILAAAMWGHYLPLLLKQTLLAVAITVKSVVIFLLPILIFGLIFLAMQQLASQASRLVLYIVGGVVISNFVATYLSQFIGRLVYEGAVAIAQTDRTAVLEPLWRLELPALIPNDQALLGGFVMGWLSNRVFPATSIAISHYTSRINAHLLSLFKVSIPLFVLGFILKLQHEGTLTTIVTDYGLIVFVVGFSQFVYIFMLYMIGHEFSLLATLRSSQNLFSAVVCGFSTMSSAASMPYTMAGVHKFCDNKKLANIVIPATVNIHLLGDCIAIPIFAYAVLKGFQAEVPSLLAYAQFCVYFVLAKFSVAAIPAGGILVMLPILQKYMGFHDEMTVMITALYVLFDPFITAMNILGNGAFAKLMDRAFGKAETIS